jgi:hypothetical protein
VDVASPLIPDLHSPRVGRQTHLLSSSSALCASPLRLPPIDVRIGAASDEKANEIVKITVAVPLSAGSAEEVKGVGFLADDERPLHLGTPQDAPWITQLTGLRLAPPAWQDNFSVLIHLNAST